MKNIGIFGGSFNPFHLGHLQALKAFIGKYDFEKVLVIPTGIPPHKELTNNVNDCDRLEMVRLSVKDINNIEISDYEIKKQGRSYTAETLEYLKSCYPDSHFILYTGSDMFLTLEKWHMPEKIFSLAEIAAFSRKGNDFKELEKQKKFLEDKYNAKCTIFKDIPLVISSTDIQEMIKNRNDPSTYLSKNVFEYIKGKNLYQNQD